jgi:deoxyadenosine/deoxycytidine kinase
MSPIIVSIEGNIGSGKSTLLANLRNYYKNESNIVFLKEPVDEWEKIKDENGTTILEKFYSDQEKYSFPFQMMAYVSRLKVLRDALKNIREKEYSNKTNINNNKTIIITERSLYTDKMVFAKMLYDNGKIEHINYQIYLNWFDTFSEEFPVHKIVYVKTCAEKCHLRIMKRARDGESNIPLDYLHSCNIYHNNMLEKSSNECVCNEQLILDGNIDIYENETQLYKWIREINDFITK